MNLSNLQSALLNSSIINNVSDENDLTKKINITLNKEQYNNLYKGIINSYISNEAPNQGFRKKKNKIENLSDLEISEYEKRKINNITIKEKINNDIVDFIINNKVLKDFQGKRISKPIFKLISTDNSNYIYQASFDLFEMSQNINLNEIEIDQIIYSSEVNEDQLKDFENKILETTFEDEIFDENKKVSDFYDELKDLILVLDFEGKLIYGKKKIKFQGGSAQDLKMQIGKGKMLPDFEANLYDMKINDEKTFEIIFPKDYHQSLSNQKAEFKVKLKQIFKLSKYTDINQYLEKNNKTHEDIKNELKEKLSQDIEFKKNLIEREQLFEKLDEMFVNMPIPSSSVEKEFLIAKQNYQEKQKNQKLLEENHIHDENCNHSDDEKIKEFTDDEIYSLVKTKTRLMILMSTIANKNNITLSQADLFEEIFFQAKRMGMDQIQAIQYFQSNKQAGEFLQKAALETKVIKFCISNAKKNQKTMSSDEINELYKNILDLW